MIRMRKLVAAIALSYSAVAWAGAYDNIYLFGDSLSDSGAYTALTGAGQNKFTTNSGGTTNLATTWGENLGAKFGLTVAPGLAFNGSGFVATGGNDYAIGGARIAATPGVFPVSDAIASVITPLAAQVDTHLSQTGGVARSNALYAYWGGANDVFYQAGLVGAGIIGPTDAGSAIVSAGTAAALQIATIKAAGAKNIVVLALPDMGVNPYAASLAASGGDVLLTGLSTAFNDSLSLSLSSVGATNLLYLDPRSLMADMLARPTAYGIANTTLPACGAASSLGCVAPAGTENFFFADGVHPSAAVHQILSDWVYASLAAPSQFVSLAMLPLGRSGAQWRAMDDRLRGFATQERHQGGLFVTADYAPTRIDSSAYGASASGTGKSVTVGLEHIRGNLLGGIAMGYADTGFDLGNRAGNVDYTETIFSAYGGAKFGAAYVDLLASYGAFDYDTRRNVSASSNIGSTNAHQHGFKLGTGYNLVSGNLTHGPVAALAYEKVTVDAFTETGATALSFGKQTRTSLRHRIGWQGVWNVASAGGTRFMPYVRITHEREYEDNQGYLNVSQAGSAFVFSAPTSGKKESWGVLAFGTSVKLNEVSLQLGATTNFGQSGVRNHSVAVGASLPF